MSATIDGSMQPFEDDNAPQTWTKRIKGRASLKVTMAYKMVVLQGPKNDWKDLVITAAKMKLDFFLRSEETPSCFHPLSTILKNHETEVQTSPEGPAERATQRIAAPQGVPTKTSAKRPWEHIEFMAWRHLEHILSVCVIPMTATLPTVGKSNPPSDTQDNTPPVACAITCGDLAGHRICTSASYFSFEFLLNCASRLKRLPDDVLKQQYFKGLMGRIRKACEGHITWLGRLERNSERCFGANYWANGKSMNTESTSSWVPKDSFVDTAFQLLKITSFTKEYQQADNAHSKRLIKDYASAWLMWLEKSDQRTKYAWPHAVEDGINIFRLDDHVWIWMALKSLEDEFVNFWRLVQAKVPELAKGNKDTKTPMEAPSKDEVTVWSRKYSSLVIQREVLRRFTTENDARKRLLAVTRSTRETRVLFHARDTALFYGQDKDFFLQNTSTTEPWSRTIKSQLHHEENQELWWENAMRYALSIVVGSRGYRINSRPPDELVRTATEALFRIASPNGFFPGQLDMMTQVPFEDIIYEESDRDFYYHTNSEIQYVLLTHADNINNAFDSYQTSGSAATSGTSNMDDGPRPGRPPLGTALAQAESRQETSQLIESALARILPQLSDILSRQVTGLSPGLLQVSAHNAWKGSDEQRLVMKKVVPFNSLIDSTNIVQLEDEWMFNYPWFFSDESGIDINTTFANALLQAAGDSRLFQDLKPGELAQRYSSSGSQENSRTRSETKSTSSASSSLWRGHFFVVDVPRQKRRNGKRVKLWSQLYDMERNEDLWKHLSSKRTAKSAKKRLVHLYDANPETAFICAAASRGHEGPLMAEFFGRHSLCEKSHFDHCTLIFNKWDTEVHMSFYKLIDMDKSPRQGLLALDPLKVQHFPGDQNRQIVKSVVSFRFAGDFFDRYWTCHILQHDYEGIEEDLRKNEEWRQRRVLELYLFMISLRESKEHTGGIFDAVKQKLGVDANMGSFSYSVLDSDAYSSRSRTWQGFENLLQALEEDLTGTLDIVNQWNSREEVRGKEQPRWTRNDERKHRGAVNQQLFKVKRQVNQVRKLRDDIKALREWYSNRLRDTREELGFRSDQNIISFTYVTVVFLPLGFAASIFSMSGSPEGSLIASMVILAVVALAVTVLAVINARAITGIGKDVLETMGKIAKAVQKFTEKTMRTSIITQSQQQRTNQEQNKEAGSTEADISERPGEQESRIVSTSSVLAFWLTYLLIEVPVRNIFLAYRVLAGEDSDQPAEQATRGWAQRNILMWLKSAIVGEKKQSKWWTDTLMRWWTETPDRLRPVRNLDRKIREMADDKPQTKKRGKETNALVGGEEGLQPERPEETGETGV
ncbi:hypothetical protein VPNG_04041 [Cytospora leucostoma]|uniref:Mg2+ transporter zinc transport protein n=1 Tax=Cytospora leucostoma TaxID=1230097 RepID=A0A423XD92_9PEZI|nr:hypothetical protein VPNG_04041 [Cytospora leucostoma]